MHCNAIVRRLMPDLQIRPFSDEHLDDAAGLLAARHGRHRETEPLLPQSADFRTEIEREWRVEGASGVAALSGGELVGYLVASPRRFGSARDTWMVVGIAGHAVAADAELVRDLYAAAAAAWADAGHTRHAAFVPSADASLVDAWFRLSFGASGALAIRETTPEQPFDAGLRIRHGTSDDLVAAARLDRLMTESMISSPSFSPSTTPSTTEAEEEWRDTWDDEQFEHFVAERDGRIVGHIVLYRRPPDLRVPANSIDLAAASTEPEARGSGVGRALTEHVLAWAHAAGIPVMVIDWRMTNLYASRFWPRRGFRPTFLRLYRHLP
ncbi:MAG: GNAT family N-acetyltransferase [Actinobacteria bacterium]|nr:MAG: GNAT family N-acetyltransferase [Actinomycetota bacterium]